MLADRTPSDRKGVFRVSPTILERGFSRIFNALNLFKDGHAGFVHGRRRQQDLVGTIFGKFRDRFEAEAMDLLVRELEVLESWPVFEKSSTSFMITLSEMTGPMI